MICLLNCWLTVLHVQVPTMQKFRKGIPASSSVYICKNSLMKEAVKVTPGWDMIAEKGCTVSHSLLL